MSGNFFDKLELDLAALTREGTHLERSARNQRLRVVALIRRSAMIVILAVALAASVASEFPAVANGHGRVAQLAAVRAL
jgi:hypothetical protein